MFQVAEGKSPKLKDVAELIELINNPPPDLRDFFDFKSDIFIARAPGRLDVMGGIADYSGSLVLEMPIAEATVAAVQKCDARSLKIVSLSNGERLIFEMPLGDFEQMGEPISYAAARACFAEFPENHWASYVAGIFLGLMRERGVIFEKGASVLISSDVPAGKGVSSSAALEVATMQAVSAAFDIRIEPRETAILCQTVENLIVGAPCGVMDQMTSACGEENRLLALLCQPAELQGTIEIPDEIAFWGIDSGVRHAVVGADYGSVRVGAFMGYRIICELAGLNAVKIYDGVVKIEDSRWNNYLSNVLPSEFERLFAAQIPERIGGAEFLDKYQGTTDSVTKIHPEKVYPVKLPTAHAIYENFRVRAFAELLKGAINERKLQLLGELMLQSHASYAACGLCEKGTNRLVEFAAENRSKNLYGAKITGGGSGGTVAILGLRKSEFAVREIARKYSDETGLESIVFEGSSPGATAFGYIKLKNEKDFSPEEQIIG